MLVDGHAGLATHSHELGNRRRAIDVAGHERWALALLLDQLRELAAGRCLTGTLQTANKDDGG